MVKRSLQASPAGIQRAKRAFALKGWTQENLAGEVNLKTRQPIWRFFSGQPVDRQIFMAVCSILDLDWRNIAENPPAEFPELEESREATSVAVIPTEINALVQQVRSQYRSTIQNQCGILQLLNISRLVSIDDVYVDVNILEEIVSQQWVEMSSLQNLNSTEFDQVGLGQREQPQITAMQSVENHSKLQILGKPGVGKTTFLKHLAVQCNRGAFAAQQVPIFITLRDFAEESRESGSVSLLNYICQTWRTAGVPDPSVLKTLLQEGRILLLLDGMDEVLNRDSTDILREIRRFSEKYHKNQFVVSCRIAAQKLQLPRFTDVEIAPFTQAQITDFAQKWFVTLAKRDPQTGQAQSTQFIQELSLPKNWQFRQLVVTPLFLHLACWMFQGQDKFPAKRSEFYKQGLNLLLGKWDEAKGIDRDEIYQDFRLPQKLRLLSQLASVTFEQGQYFFEQHIIEQYIEEYLRTLPGVMLDPEELNLDSEAMLKAIESQHGILIERARGIFSFSYFAFQEYFTARKIVTNHNLQELEQSLERLVSHITDPHWREVFLITVAMLRNADSLMQLMKQEINALVAQDPYLQEFLIWTDKKSQTILSQPKAATRSLFYLMLTQSSSTAAHFTLDSALDQGAVLDAALKNLLLEFAAHQSQDFAHINACSEALNKILVMVLDAEFYKSLQQLKDQLPSSCQSWEQMQAWWQQNYPTWVAQARSTIAHYRNIYHPWQFTPEQQQVLQHYYRANQLLIDCLNSNCEVTDTVRQEIEATLLLPQKELDDRE